MNKTKQVSFRMNREEYERLQERAAKTRLTPSGYLRMVADGSVPRQAPPLEYGRLINSMNRCAERLSLLADYARAFPSLVDTNEVNEINRELRASVLELRAAVELPERVKY